ncbi:S8 family serine peptidase [Modestobacter sp. VKM Ac-2986]|uniref:S8 family serine peptidase n=1 Tax=Modestobacter sp. VKM Ac-2986 TaxID=3004140 RepID=UPI0022AB715C|nr:S8 family serine peptidase [Modestobacter sp. VKM Ac-2986]MCZ2829513.1 S8 family serine peptidase [Modestobacter sp. VKM Ac-2986]
MTAALVTTGGLGSALAAPAGVAQRVAGQPAAIDLTPAQLDQVRSQLADRADSTRLAGLPDSGPASFFLRIDTPSTSQVYADALATGGQAEAADAARSAQPAVEAAADDVVSELPAVASGAEVLYTASTVVSGVAVSADAADYEALRTLPGVTAVLPITPKEISNTGAAAVVRAVDAWESLGNTGKDVSIGIIDTGIDYTHADFGGSGDVAQFDALQAAEKAPAPGVFPSAKVVGGHDFVGDDYNADPSSDAYQPVAHPDENPLDCNGHGTHVAGSSAGYGVNADGSTYTGTYGAGFDAGALKIGPGMAPDASLYALKVFGCEGSTDVTIKALEWAMDPNGDGSIDDHLDVVNLSLGSDYGLADDADAMVADEAMAHGMLVVLAAGNAGDAYDIGGSPGNAPRGIGVAASNDGYGVFDGWRVDSPAGVIDGVRPGLRSLAYEGTGDVTGPLVLPPAGHEDGCTLPAGYAVPAGSVQLFLADGFADCGSVGKGTNAVRAGAAGFMIVGDDDLLETGITGVAQIPGILVTGTDGEAVIGAVSAGQTVTVTFGDSLKDASVFTAPEQVDLLASFSSRGTRQANGLKPDVSAPGVTLFSAAVGTGDQGVSESGTSMATPTTAGVTALVRAAHPEWTTEEVKADLMNTAGHDVHTADGTVYGPNRQGAGRIDAKAALDNQVLAYAEAGTGVVSASFGVVEVAAERVQATKVITVANKGTSAAVYRVAYQALVEQPGVRYSLSAQRVTVPPGQTRTVTVTMTASQDELRKVADPTVVVDDGRQFVGEASGRVVLSPINKKGVDLRVPVHSNAKPASTLSASASGDGSTITLTGGGVANGEAYEPSSYTSLVDAFEQLGTSPEMPRCSTTPAPDCYKSELERSVDLASVGVASDVRAFADDPGLYVAVAAHGTYTSPETAVNYGVYIDATGDGQWDYQVTTTRIADYDVALVVITDRNYDLLPSNDAPYIGALNLVDGLVDTNALDNDVQVMGVPLSAMPLVQGRISFGVQSISAYGTVDDLGTGSGEAGTELSTPMSFDPLAPGLSFTGPGGDPALLLPATGGTTITVTQDPVSYAADVAVGGTKGALVVLPHNDSATGRAQSVPVAPAATAVSAPPAG